MTGRRPTNSGIRPYLSRSSWMRCCSGFSPVSIASTRRRRSPSARACRCAWPTISSSPSNAPPQMKRMLRVSIWMYSWCGCLRPLWGGTLATVPSMILSSACCTPSPETSRVIEGLSDLRAILSISSM